MGLRSLLCSLVIVSALIGDCAFLDNKVAHAQFIGDKPFSGGRRPIEINLHGQVYYGFDWYDGLDGYNPYYTPYAVGAGFSMLFPVIQNGFISTINDAFYIGFFTDFNFHPTYLDPFLVQYPSFVSLAIGPYAQWRFFLFPILSVYANLGFGIWPWFLGSTPGNFCRGCADVVIRGFPMFELGANLHFTRNIGMNFEFGYPWAKVGLNIGF
jgi:hypothetical protein